MAESPIPAEAVEAVIEGIDHESIERHGLDRAAVLAVLRIAAPFLAEHIATLLVTTPKHPEASWRAWASRLAREAFPKDAPDAT